MIELVKPVRRRVRTLRGDVLVLELTVEGIVLREPRRKKRFLLPYESAYMVAVRADVDKDRREKKASSDKPAKRTKVTRGLLSL